MKTKGDEGFTLLETMIAIVILGLVVVPTCSSLVLSFRMNAKADKMLRDQLAVSSAVETLMAEGIEKPSSEFAEGDYGNLGENEQGIIEDRFPDVKIEAAKEENADPFYTVTVSRGEVSVQTVIREVVSTAVSDSTEGEGE